MLNPPVENGPIYGSGVTKLTQIDSLKGLRRHPTHAVSNRATAVQPAMTTPSVN